MIKNKLYKFLASTLFILLSFNISAQLIDFAALDTLPTYTLEEALKQNPLEVYKLNLKKQKLTELPKEIYQFKNLQVLDAQKNKLKTFPKRINEFTLLQELNITANKIEIVTKELGSLVHLKKFRAGSNLIISIPPEIKHLKTLEYIDLWGNNIGFLPLEIEALKDNLKEIDMRVIQMNKQEHQKIKELLPNTKIRFSESCGCGF
ncbi:MAG: leucine-rich repeat domain-containing protein [Vicingaceae bacterium]